EIRGPVAVAVVRGLERVADAVAVAVEVEEVGCAVVVGVDGRGVTVRVTRLDRVEDAVAVGVGVEIVGGAIPVGVAIPLVPRADAVAVEVELHRAPAAGRGVGLAAVVALASPDLAPRRAEEARRGRANGERTTPSHSATPGERGQSVEGGERAHCNERAGAGFPTARAGKRG